MRAAVPAKLRSIRSWRSRVALPDCAP